MQIINQTTETAPIDTVRPHPQNPRQGDIDAIHTSIKTNDFYTDYAITNGKYDLNAYANATGGTITTDYQFRYIYPIHPTARERLTVPEIPYHAIPPHARMYRGKRAFEAGDGQHPVGTAVVQR